MSNPSRVTIVDLGEAYSHLRSFVTEMYSDGHISRESMLRYQGNLKTLIQQATDYKTAPLVGSDL